MLGAEIAAYNKRIQSGGSQQPQRTTPSELPSIAGLHVSGPSGHASPSTFSQSLPSSSHLTALGDGPPKPQVRPSDPPRTSLSQLPILELPEASPNSNSLLRAHGVVQSRLGATVRNDESSTDQAGGTCADLLQRAHLEHAFSSHTCTPDPTLLN